MQAVSNVTNSYALGSYSSTASAIKSATVCLLLILRRDKRQMSRLRDKKTMECSKQFETDINAKNQFFIANTSVSVTCLF